MDMDKTFTKDCNELFKQQQMMGDRARDIITAFVQKHGGRYEIDNDPDCHAWVGEEVYATALELESTGNVLVYNSGGYSESLHDMGDRNILDLAMYLNGIN